MTVVLLLYKDITMKINRILAVSLFCFVPLVAMIDEELEPAAGSQAPVAASMGPDVPINLPNELRKLNQQLNQAHQRLKILATPFTSERYRVMASDQKEWPVIQLYQTLIRSRELFGEYTVNLAVDLLWDAQDQGQEDNIRMFSHMLARLEIVGSATMSDEQLSSIQFRGSGVKEAIEERSKELFDIFRHKDSKERLKEKLEARIKVLPVEQRSELYICLKHFLRDIDAAIIIRNFKDDDIRREGQQLAEVEEQVRKLSQRIRPYVNHYLESLRAITDTIRSIRQHFRKYMLEGIESDRHEPLSNADRNLIREIDAFFEITQENIEKEHKNIDQALREFVELSADIENIKGQIEKLFTIKGTLDPALLPHDDPRYNEYMQALEREQDVQRRQPGSLQRVVQGVLSVAKKAAPLVVAFAQSLSPQYRTIDTIPQELTTIQRNITSLIEHLNAISQKFRSAALSEQTVIENLRILSKIFDMDNDDHHEARIGFNEEAWQDIYSKIRKRNKDGQDARPEHGKIVRSIVSDKEQSFHIPYQEEIEQSMAKQILASSLRTHAVKGLLNHILKPSKQGQGMQLIPMVSLDSVMKSMFPEYETLQRPVETLEPQSSLADRVADGVRSLAHPSKTLLRGVGRAIEEHVPELPQILAHPRGEQGYMQPNGAQTFDDTYTTAIIGTRNVQYILYDIAARTRFNTGRFSYLIRPLVHMLEEKVGGPLKVGEEEPGDRYHDIMKALSDESTPLEHPWILFSIPPRVVGLIETVLRVANADGQGFPEVKKRQQESVSQGHLKSTSLGNLIWNIAKKVAAKPFSAMAKWVKGSCISFGNGVKQCAQYAYAPFKKPLKSGRESIGVAFNCQLKKCPKLSRIVEHVRAKGSSALRYSEDIFQRYATPQGIARKIRALLPIGIVGTLERYMREGHPASEQLALLQNFIANHRLEVFTDTITAAISHNSQRIRDFANKYLRIQRIDPITADVISDERLRSDLGSFAQAWPRVQQWHQNHETGEWTVQRVAVH